MKRRFALINEATKKDIRINNLRISVKGEEIVIDTIGECERDINKCTFFEKPLAIKNFALDLSLSEIFWHSLQKHGYAKIWIHLQFLYQTTRQIAKIESQVIPKKSAGGGVLFYVHSTRSYVQ